MKWKNAAEAYWWVYNHPKLVCEDFVHPWIEITPQMVDDRGVINEDKSLNISIAWWIEFGPYHFEAPPWNEDGEKEFISEHDWECDCGGATAEEAVLKLAKLVLKKYGDYNV